MQTPVVQIAVPANNAQTSGAVTHASPRQNETPFASVLRQKTQKAPSGKEQDKVTPPEKPRKKVSRSEEGATSNQAQPEAKAVPHDTLTANPATNATGQPKDGAGDNPQVVPGANEQLPLAVHPKLDLSALSVSVESEKPTDKAAQADPKREAITPSSAGAAPETAGLSLEGFQTIGVKDIHRDQDGKNKEDVASDSSHEKTPSVSNGPKHVQGAQDNDPTTVTTGEFPVKVNSSQVTPQAGGKDPSSNATGDPVAAPDTVEASSIISMKASIDGKPTVPHEPAAQPLAQQVAPNTHLRAESSQAEGKLQTQQNPLVTPSSVGSVASGDARTQQADGTVITSVAKGASLASSASLHPVSGPKDTIRAKEDPASESNTKRGPEADPATPAQPVIHFATPHNKPAEAIRASNPGEGSDDHEAGQSVVTAEKQPNARTAEERLFPQVSFTQSIPRPETGATSGPSTQSLETTASADVGKTVPVVETQGMHIGRIVNSARLSDQMGQAEMQVKLQSDALGPITLRATVHNNQVGAAIRVETHETHAILAAELPALEHALSEKNLRVENISILQNSVSGETSQGQGRDTSQGQYSQPRPTQYQWSQGHGESLSPEATPEPWYVSQYSTRLNVRA